MQDNPYIPELTDADFRRLIDARKLVVIRFWDKQRDQGREHFINAVNRHPEIAFAQVTVEAHHTLATRTQSKGAPSFQGWVDGTLFINENGPFDGRQIDDMARKMAEALNR